MKVLHLDSENTWRGGQNQIRLLVEGSVDAGIESYVAAPRESALFDVMREKVPTLSYTLRHGLDFRAAKELGQYCLDQGIDVIDAHSSKAHTVALFALGFTPFAKLVVHRRVDYVPSYNPLNLWKYRTSRVARYVAISRAIGNVLKNYGIAENRIEVVHSAASELKASFASKEAAKNAIAEQEDLDPRVPWIGNCSALTEQKDYPLLIEAVSILKRKGLRFQCLIAGAGKLERSLKGSVSKQHLDTHVRFLGFRDDVPEILQALDILSISSEYEGLGTIILDALSLGCAVVATDVGGIPEVIQHGGTGLLSPIKDAEAFAANLEKLINSPSQRQLLATSGQKKVVDEFSAEQMVARNIAVYKSLFE